MLTLTYGYKKPQLDDTGDVFFPALEADIQQLNDHTHDGVTSALIPTVPQSVDSANWVAVAGLLGVYSQDVTMSAPYQYDTTQISVKDVAGNVVQNQINKSGSNVFTIFTNDSTQNLTVEYGS